MVAKFSLTSVKLYSLLILCEVNIKGFSKTVSSYLTTMVHNGKPNQILFYFISKDAPLDVEGEDIFCTPKSATEIDT